MKGLILLILLFIAFMEYHHPKTVRDYVENDTIRYLYLKECSYPSWYNAEKCDKVLAAEAIKRHALAHR